MASKQQKLKWLLAGAVSALLYYLFAYELIRSDTAWLQISFAALFICFLFMLNVGGKWLLSFAVVFRMIFLFSLPALSDDFYRFIWDGLLWHGGMHPFSHTPDMIIQSVPLPGGIATELYEGLNSKGYYTVYPPLHQLVFWLSTFNYSGNILEAIVPMRLILIAADLTLIGFLLNRNNTTAPQRGLVAFYALNPLVIVETAGNLHFEGMVTLFLLLAIYYVTSRNVTVGAASLAAAIATKLTPLIAAPALLPVLPGSSRWRLVLITGMFCLLMFLPLFEPLWTGGQVQSLGLYFKKFEFNASLYYIFRELGFWIKGYNVISSLGPAMAASAGALILLVSWSKQIKFPTAFHTVSVVFMIYYLFATTVHPWYIVPLLGLSVFTGYLFPLVWSYAIFWTYTGYNNSGYDVPWMLIALEYLLVAGVFLWEVLLPLRTREVSGKEV